MRWIKASETKPEEGKKVFIRWKHRLTKQDEWDVLYDTSRVFGDAKFWELEWLDESSSPSTLKDVIEEMERLLTWLSNESDFDLTGRNFYHKDDRDGDSPIEPKEIIKLYSPKLKQLL